MNPTTRKIRNAIAVVILLPIAAVVLPAWCLFRMGRFLWEGLDEGWAELQEDA